ncbi:hypothetical protein V8G61_01065 [Gaetbulibacter sp. M240]|uniref:hypothetical protein n=1 Tax=Gaetbulibacter sp. M240 TaxID=3126511 RepID=UPI00374FA2F2
MSELFIKTNVESHLIEFKDSTIFKALYQNNITHYSLQNYLKLKFILFPRNSTLFIAKFLKKLINPVTCASFFFFFLIILYLNAKTVSNSQPLKAFWFGIYLVLLVIFHEFGHVSALYKFTKESSSIGFGIYLISPVLFADVTKAWSLNKYKRIIINVAGIYFEFIFLIIVSVILIINSISINNLIILFFIRCLFNLNPFFRTDGYWIVSDYFEIPNLKLKSITQIKRFLSPNRKHYDLNYFLIFYSLISYVIITFFVGKIIISKYSNIIDFPSKILKLFKGNLSMDYFIENYFIVIVIYILAIHLILKKITLKYLKK